MKIVTCIKQVPETTDVKINIETGTLIRDGVPSILNPFDQFALEESIKLRDIVSGTVTAITMGPPQAKSALIRCLALGADSAILLTDRKFAGADTFATAYTLTLAIKKIGYDVIFCGQQAIDGDTAQVGPEIASQLDIPQVTYCEKVKSVQNNKIIVKRQCDEGYEIIECVLPCVLTLTPYTSFIPQDPKFSKLRDAKKTHITEWCAEDLSNEFKYFGLSGSKTEVIRVYTPERRKKGCILQEASAELTVKKLIEYLKI